MPGKLIRVGLLLCSLCFVLPALGSEDEAWLHGKWELSYDPDGAQKDYLEFLANGDAWSIGPNGRVPGIYIVDGDTVKAVFTWKGRDFIMHFHADKQRQQLTIITSRSGKASIYTKMEKP